jgi:hypothetical protein
MARHRSCAVGTGGANTRRGGHIRTPPLTPSWDRRYGVTATFVRWRFAPLVGCLGRFGAGRGAVVAGLPAGFGARGVALTFRVPGSGTWADGLVDVLSTITGVIGVPSGDGLRAAFVTDRPSAILTAPSGAITTIGTGPSRGAIGFCPVRPKRTEFKNRDLQAVKGMRCRVAQPAHHMLATLMSRSTTKVRMDHWVPQDHHRG